MSLEIFSINARIIINIWTVGVARPNTSPCHGEDHGFESRTVRMSKANEERKEHNCFVLFNKNK